MQQVKAILDNVSDSVGVSLATKTTFVSGLTGIFSSIAEWNWTSIIASSVAIVGLVMNFYFQRRRDKREAAVIKAQIASLKQGCDSE